MLNLRVRIPANDLRARRRGRCDSLELSRLETATAQG